MKLALGTVQFGLNYGVSNTAGQVSKEEVVKILTTALDAKIDTLDTAPSYGNSEKILGDLPSSSPFKICSKIPHLDDDHNIPSHLQESLSSLKRESLEYYIFHNSDDLLNTPSLLNDFLKVKELGLVKKIGFSLYNVSQFHRLLKIFTPDIIQIPVNIFSQDFINDPVYQSLNVEVHARSVFLQGSLLTSKEERHPYFNLFKNKFNDYETFCERNNMSKLEACLNFVKTVESIDKILIGVQTQEQLLEILKAYRFEKRLDYSSLNSGENGLINPLQWKLNV